MTKKYGPWTVLPDGKRPEHLRNNQTIQPVCISTNGTEVQTDMLDRAVAAHIWSERTIAYRLRIETETYVAYGRIGYPFNAQRYSEDTHKITYEIDGGKVVSCKMEAL